MNAAWRRLGMWLALTVVILLPGKKAAAIVGSYSGQNVSNPLYIRDGTPLYLEHVRDIYGDGPNIQTAGHRSHRSHSSHRSHYSSSSPSTPSEEKESTPTYQPERITPKKITPPTKSGGDSRPNASTEDFLKKGISASRAGRYTEAIDLYKKTLAHEPSNFMAHNNLGVANFKMGKNDAAIESLRRAIAIKPEYADAHYNLGVVLQEKGSHAEASTEYQKACDLGISDACKMVNK